MSLLGKILNKKEDKRPVAKKKAATVVDSPKAEVKVAAPVVDANKAIKSSMKRIDVDAYRVLLQPLITEKATDLAARGKYVFITPIHATKNQIAKTVANIYGVKPVKVNLIRGKVKYRRSGKVLGKTTGYKKAIVTLAPGAKIEIYEGV
ncbi:MAG: 50S ribosomal protein L23 [Parcubacteria group bacterium]